MTRRRLGSCLLTLGLAFTRVLCASARAQEVQGHAPHGRLRAVRTAAPPTIDGRLTDECWELAQPVRGLTQMDPDEGQPATEDTEIRVLFDDAALYVSARMFDKEPALVARRLSKRDDDADADRISILIDPMHDHLTGAIFRVSAAGVQDDSVLHNDTWTDGSWDAVWNSAVSADDQGWSAPTMSSGLSGERCPIERP